MEELSKVEKQRAISKQIAGIVIPIILESMLQMSAGIVTSAMIGRLLAVDISAQGVCLRIYNTFWALFKGVGIGTTVIVALRYGEGKLERCRRIFEQALFFSQILGVVAMGAVFFFPRFFLELFTSDPAIIEKSLPFLSISLLAYPCMITTSMVTGAFNGQGNTKTPMYLAILANIVNIIVGYLFIFGSFGFPNLGLRGAAVALVCAQLTNGGVGLFLLYNRKFGLYSAVEKTGQFCSFDWGCIREVYATGLPAGCENLFMQFSSIIMSKVILTYGTDYFAAYQLGMQAEGLCDMLSIGFATAATTLMASALGKRDDELFRAYFKQLLKSAMMVSSVAFLAFFLLPRFLMGLLTNNQTLIEIGIVYVMMMGVIQFQLNISRVVNGTMRAVGYKNVPMLVSGMGIWLIRVPLAMLFGWVLHLDIFFIWLVIVIDQSARCVLSAVLFMKKKILDVVLRLNEQEAAALKG